MSNIATTAIESAISASAPRFENKDGLTAEEQVLQNKSGIVPVEYKVLIKVQTTNKNDKGEEVTDSGIVIPKQTTEREEMAKVEGTLIDFGGSAFSDWHGRSPKAGETVLISKYAGMTCKGVDKEEYRLCNDKDIAAIVVKA